MDVPSPSESLTQQRQVERAAAEIYREATGGAATTNDRARLRREDHVAYLARVFKADRPLPKGFTSLNAGRPWLCYWSAHGLYLLGAIDSIVAENPGDASAMVSFLGRCQHESGGFGGSPGQLPHLATTYAAVSALVTLGTDEALAVIDRPKLLGFLLSMCQSRERGGGMTMHDGGEVDVRGCYCALCVCYMLGMPEGRLVVEASDMGRFIGRCQGHEGGIGGEPGNEGHGGYTFCAYGALALAEACGWLPGGTGMVDRGLLASWLRRQQGNVEGGMRGRTNKLVDGCYSFWCGGLGRLLAGTGEAGGEAVTSATSTQGATQTQRGVVENAALADAVRRWCDNTDDQYAGLQRALDDVMERYLVAEEQCRADPSPGAQAAFVRLGEEAFRLQERVEDMKSREVSTKCLDELRGPGAAAADGRLIDPEALQMWILLACQVPDRGGLRDKPGTNCDFYHSCYCLSGLAAAQAVGETLGGAENRLCAAHPICNIGIDKIERSIAFYKGSC